MTAADPPNVHQLLAHAAWVQRLAQRLWTDVAAADDAAQEALLAALRRPPATGSNLRGWLATLLRNAWRGQRRTDARRQARELAAMRRDTVEEPAVDAVARTELHQFLVTQVLALPEPQRSLVLEHYFEHRELAALARRHALTIDAVQAHLRRARNALRLRLDGQPRHRRVLAAVCSAGTAAKLATITTGVLVMTTKAKSVMAAAVVLVAVLTWWQLATVDPVPELPSPTASAPEPVRVDTGAALAGTPTVDPDSERSRAAVLPQRLATNGTFVVLLRGLHAEAPFADRVHFDLEARLEGTWVEAEDAQVPDRDGRIAFALPEWLATAQFHRLRIRCDATDYRDFDLRFDEPPDWRRELVIDVQVIARLTGRVLGPAREPIQAARIVAFAFDKGIPVDRKLGETTTARDGTFVLRAPPEVRLLLLAVPMQEARLSGALLTGREGAIADCGNVRDDLLPGSVETTGRIGAVTAVPDIVLAAATPIRGHVRWTDGRPVPKALVGSQLTATGTFVISDTVAVQRLAGERLAATAVVETDDRGFFVLPGLAGADFRVAVSAVAGHLMPGEWPFANVRPPQLAEVRVPLPVRLLVTQAGVPVPRARVEFPGIEARTEADGAVAVIVTEPEPPVVAHASRLRSATRTLTSADAGREVELRLDQPMAELAIEFKGDHRVRNAFFRWQQLDGDEHGGHHGMRDDSSGPFRLLLPPGGYRLQVGPAGGERNGLFLLPQEHVVQVPATGQRLTLQAAFGGHLHVHVTDHRGVHVAGSCRLFGPDGQEIFERFVVRNGDGTATNGLPGELLPGGVNEFGAVLPPGRYDLQFDLGTFGMRREQVTIAARETADLRLRL
ncbi:MAG: hypothetical protein IPK26_00585 [Planctomycetes bacterium]|nr:hypothetical protein [Planctomycetota bacterium]